MADETDETEVEAEDGAEAERVQMEAQMQAETQKADAEAEAQRLSDLARWEAEAKVAQTEAASVEAEAADEVIECKPYYQRVLDGEIEGPLFQHVDEAGNFTDYTLEEVIASEKSNAEKRAWLEAQITSQKASLVATDYIAIKIAEGAATATEYAEQIASRKAVREAINEMEAQIDALDNESEAVAEASTESTESSQGEILDEDISSTQSTEQE